MIPLRLMLENFMCYREKTEIDFRGSVIWAFRGHNGSGKSTILDAMRYVLYGEHRAGKQKIEALIHRSATAASSFAIEFDFAIGDNQYRVQRTYSQKKKGTMQALYLAGPDAPLPGRPGPQFIPGTNTKEEFDRWVLKTIGLDERAFTVSVLLLQGQSDKLLKLGGSERHEVLTHIIDLSRYDALAKRALEKQKIQDTSVKVYKGQLDGLEKIDETSITAAEQRVSKAEEEKERARKRQLALTTLKEQAQRWQQLQGDKKYLQQRLARFERLLEQSEQIERDASRLAILQQVMQPLIQIQQKQVDISRFQHIIEQNREQATTLEATIQRTCDEQRKVQQQIEAARACYQKQDREQKAVQAELLALQVPCNDITRLQEKQQAYQKLLHSLATFVPDLEQQQLRLRGRLDEISGIETAVPLLKRFANFRREWQQAIQDLNSISQNLHDQKVVQEQAVILLQALDKTREEIRERASQLQSKVASQKALLTECQKRFARFHTIEGGATCSYCGQLLTAEHLDTERQRINEELQAQDKSFQLCTTEYNEALQQQKTVNEDIQQAKEKEQQELQAYEQLTQRQITLVRKRDTAYIETKNQLEQLTTEYRKQIQGTAIASVDMDTCFQATYPTPQELAALSLQLREKPTLTQELQVVEDALTKREGLRRKQEYIFNEIELLLQTYPPERARVLLEKREQTHQRNGDLSDALQELSVEIEKQEQQVLSFADEERTAREKRSHLEQELAVARTHFEHAQRTIAEIQDQLPLEWLVHIPHLSPEMFTNWRQEIRELQRATEQYQALIEARQYHSQSKQALVELENEQCRLPGEAQRMPQQVQEEIDQTNTLYQELENLERRCREEVHRLQGISKRRQELQQQWTEATRLASRYKELAYLLGREGLQHYLLQNAEIGIVYHANEILDRISGGTLRLELRPDSESRTKALDMVAYNSAISSHESQSIDLLSGSQQFRVAISLAIGIGQYLGKSSHRVESIMIDEGFGSLDAGSRDEMIQALQALEDDFRCVIVISHQNEFSDKFPNRYEAELVDGRTKITLV